MKVESSEERTVIKKKEAIPHFTAYLKEVYGEEPTEISVYYTGRVAINYQPTQLYLMHYKLPNGYESIGITGCFTLHLDDVPMSDIEKLNPKTHKQTLVNLYHGYYLAKEELAKNPNANTLNQEDWNKFLAKRQKPSMSAVPVNVSFVDYMYLKGFHFYTYKGDMMKNIRLKEDDFPKDLNNVNVVSNDKNAKYKGDTNLIIWYIEGERTYGYASFDEEDIFLVKYYMYYAIGRKFRLLKE